MLVDMSGPSFRRPSRQMWVLSTYGPAAFSRRTPQAVNSWSAPRRPAVRRGQAGPGSDLLGAAPNRHGMHGARMDTVKTHIAGLILSIVLLGACGSPPPSARPREGAPVAVDSRSMRGVGASLSYATPRPSLVVPIATPSPTTSGQQVSDSMQPSTPSPSAAYVIGATDGAGANLRASPSTAAAVITTLVEGTPVEPLHDTISVEGRSWRKIRSGDREGWVLSVVVRPR
jgi:hypothetical protein